MWRLQIYFYIFRLKNLSVVTKKVDIPATGLITVYINIACRMHDSSYHLSIPGVLKGCASKFPDCAARKVIEKVRTHKKRFVY